MKKILVFLSLLIGLFRSAHAFSPVRQVQISTGSIPQQSGYYNVAGGSVTNLSNFNQISSGTYTVNGGTISLVNSVSTGTSFDRSTTTFQGGEFSGTRNDNSTTTLIGAVLNGTKTDNSTMTITAPITLSGAGGVIKAGTGLTAGTSGYTFISGGASTPPFWAGPRVVQTVSFTNTLSSSTIATVFVPSSLTASITPLYSTSKVFVQVSATYEIGVASSACNYQIFRNTTNLGSAFGTMEVSASGGGLSSTVPFLLEGPMSMNILDSPATTSATSYTVYMRSQHGGTVNTCFTGTGETAEIDLFEIGP